MDNNINFKNWKPFTKSKFMTALECPTKLFYQSKPLEYANLKMENEFLEALAEGGYQVGELAKYYFPNRNDIHELDYSLSIEKTNELLKNDFVKIYEAAIHYENLFVRIDIINKKKNTLELYEVKAKSYDPKKDSILNTKGNISSEWKEYLYDIAYQTFVISKAFPNFEIEPYLYLCEKKPQLMD